MVTEAWLSWSANSILMREVNAKPQHVTKGDVQTYLLEAMAKQRAVIGIFSAKSKAHLGNIEIIFDQSHLNMSLEVLINFVRYDMKAVLDEVMPSLLDELKRRFKAEKAVMVVPETAENLLRWLAQSNWTKEGLLRSELPYATENKRIDAVQYGLVL